MTNVDESIRELFSPDRLGIRDDLDRRTRDLVGAHRPQVSVPRRRKRFRHVALVTVAVAVSVGGATAVAKQADFFSPFHHTIADDLRPDADRGLERVPSEDADYFRDSLARVQRRTDVDTAPALSEMVPPGDAVVLLDGPSGEVDALRGKRGDVCYSYTFDGHRVGLTCVTDFGKNGIVYNYGDGGFGSHIAGLAEADIDSISVEGSDGLVRDADLKNSAFAWRGEQGVLPIALTIRRGDSITRVVV